MGMLSKTRHLLNIVCDKSCFNKPLFSKHLKENAFYDKKVNTMYGLFLHIEIAI